MNIFVLDEDPKTCAEYHCDKHVNKLALESAQMLSIPHNINCKPIKFGGIPVAPYRSGMPLVTKTGKIRVGAHVNHPCSVWARTSINNYKWLLELGFELCKEYTYRYGKRHKTTDVLLWLQNHISDISLPNIPMTPFAQCITSGIRRSSAVEAYRECYMQDKKHIAKWTKRKKPYWYNKQ